MLTLIYKKINAIDGAEIRTACINPQKPPIGVVQLVHGFGEGTIHYVELAEFLIQLGFACVIHDQRGHGEMPDLTPKQKHAAQGISPGYEYFLHDIKTVRTMINHKYPNLPVILYGHSMGGNIAIHYLTHAQYEYQKAVLVLQ